MFGIKFPKITHWQCAMYGHNYAQRGRVLVCLTCGDKVKT